MINAASVKAKLKNQAPMRGHILQEELTAYGLERTIYTFDREILFNTRKENDDFSKN
jgi:hypothetical protein